MRLSLGVLDQSRFHIKPLGALNAVVPSQTRQILHGLGLLVELQVPGVGQILLDLINVSVYGLLAIRSTQDIDKLLIRHSPQATPGLALCALSEDTHFE